MPYRIPSVWTEFIRIKIWKNFEKNVIDKEFPVIAKTSLTSVRLDAAFLMTFYKFIGAIILPCDTAKDCSNTCVFIFYYINQWMMSVRRGVFLLLLFIHNLVQTEFSSYYGRYKEYARNHMSKAWWNSKSYRFTEEDSNSEEEFEPCENLNCDKQ
jgi:hypothetical protein